MRWDLGEVLVNIGEYGGLWVRIGWGLGDYGWVWVSMSEIWVSIGEYEYW